MKIAIVAWGSELLQFSSAAQEAGIDLSMWQVHELRDDPEQREECIESCNGADVVLIHLSHDPIWDEILSELREGIPVISFGYTDASWSASTVPLSIVSTVSAYFLYGGPENIRNLIRYIQTEVGGLDIACDPPQETHWEGIYHPDADAVFDDPGDYLAWYPSRHPIRVGLLLSRTHWVNGDLTVENTLIRELERHYDVLPVFCFGIADQSIGALSDREVLETFFAGRIDALVDARTFTPPRDSEAIVKVLEGFGTPALRPLILYHQTEAEWRGDLDGMRGSNVSWYVAMPEFFGAIEMVPIGVAQACGAEECGERHVPIDDRVTKFVARVRKWIDLAMIPAQERRVAFILHNKPCASVEATVGAGAHLDTLESVVRILKAMHGRGYGVDYPENGEDLIRTIMERKAISDFRWTSVAEIVRKGGALALVEPERYTAWFETLPPGVRARVCETWGRPPGEEIDGVPPAMVHEGRIVVTGVRYGNALVCVQPKRGCAGPRCDGQVCRILHDPSVPPTHQYLATYRYIEETFGANVVIHVGTHGNLEFLPGKSVALSDACYPDIAIGTIPHLYIYNADNPPEGTIAKRRSYATLVDHMQTVMTSSDLYAGLKDLEDQIADYNRAKDVDRARAHALEHTIVDLLEETGIGDEIGLRALLDHGVPFEEGVAAAHTSVSRIADTRIPDGMHIFGEVPEGERRVEFIHAIMRYSGDLRSAVLRMMGHDGSAEVDGALLRAVETAERGFIAAVLAGEPLDRAAERILSGSLCSLDPEVFEMIRSCILDLAARMDGSDEIGNLLSGCAGIYIPPGPSGLITRGKPEVLPTGRNFYSLDPFRIPTRAAWRIGMRLAESVIAKYVEDQERIPENIGMYWMASDVMWADGEQLAQIFSLIGVEPVWTDGKVRSFRVTPLEELGRPRIDVTVRMSGILRDCFYTCVELLDDAIREVAALDEPSDMNFIRKHALAGSGTARIFGSQPGTYGNGVSLAVYASAWKEEADLADVFIEWNSYAYGRDAFGEESREIFSTQLATVDLTFNKTVTDEYDLLGCCGYFGTHGGLTRAVRTLSKHVVPAYYGDTRDRDRVGIRTLAEEIRRVVRAKLLNPKWIEGMKRHGYKGAGDISRQVGTVYGWEATTEEVDDRIFDDIARTFVLDQEMRQFFAGENPWALEEIGRRLLEAHGRGLWDADPDVIDGLRAAYLEIEGWIEEGMDDAGGDIQGGAVHVVTVGEAKALWGAQRKE